MRRYVSMYIHVYIQQVEIMEPKCPKKLSKWTPESPRRWRNRGYWENCETANNIIFMLIEPHVLGMLFQKTQSWKKHIGSATFDFYTTKLEKIADMVPKWSPRWSRSSFLGRSWVDSFFIWGPSWLLWRAWWSRVVETDAKNLKWNPGSPKSVVFGIQGHPQRVPAVSFSFSFSFPISLSPSSLSSCSSFSLSVSSSFSFSLSLSLSLSLSCSLLCQHFWKHLPNIYLHVCIIFICIYIYIIICIYIYTYIYTCA